MRRLLVTLMIIFTGLLAGCQNQNNEESAEKETEEASRHVGADSLYFERVSRTEIKLLWLDKEDSLVDTYTLKKRVVGVEDDEWQIVATVKSDGIIEGNSLYKVTDELVDDKPQQFEYRVDVTLDETATNETAMTEIPVSSTILASNIKVCIDPGHFDIAKEVADADEYRYVEGNFVLDVALKLRDILYWEYGIDVSMTRDTDSITLEGYTNEELDSAHISLRGEYAAEEDCDLFVSLHTNSNEEDANGYPTFFQPIEVNKPIIIVNTVALTSDIAMNAANSVGENLAATNYELGLSILDDFKTVSAENISEWTQGYNDGLNEVGTVVVRTGKKNPDYYGILRGATNVGIPGMIIEHGHHSVQEVRKEAVEGDLAKVWAEADAAGIAAGFGFSE